VTQRSTVRDVLSAEAHGIITASEFSNILQENRRNCLFCTPSSPKKILIETHNFFVTYDDSPLIEGHILIHSKEHYGCSGELPENLFKELLEIKDIVYSLVIELYGACSFYEHGRAGHCSISLDETLCEHFHLHALPLVEDISRDIATTHKDIELSSFSDVPKFFEQYDQYLLFEQGDIVHFYPVLTEIPSHFLRTVISEKIGQPERADWATAHDRDMVNSMKEKVKKVYVSDTVLG